MLVCISKSCCVNFGSILVFNHFSLVYSNEIMLTLLILFSLCYSLFFFVVKGDGVGSSG